MSDPEMRKALQEREQAFQENMKWLDEDLDRRIREEDEKQRTLRRQRRLAGRRPEDEAGSETPGEHRLAGRRLEHEAGSETPGERRLAGRRP